MREVIAWAKFVEFRQHSKRFLTPPLIVIAALLMWIEDSLWQWLKRLTPLIAFVPLIHRIELLLVRLPPYPMMFVFLLPMSLLFPLKVLAVYWATRGYWLASLTTIAAAKVFGTAIVAPMYVVCRPKLLTIAWFRRIHNWLIDTRDHLYAAIRAMAQFQAIKMKLAAIKLAAKTMLRKLRRKGGLWRRWRAIRRWHRRKKKAAPSK